MSSAPHQSFPVESARVCALRKPINATGNECHLIADHEDWTAILEPTLCQDAAAVECLARLLFTIKRAIDNGPEGVMQASRALLDGIELLYLYTNAHKAAVKLYLLSLEGNLKPQDEPLNLINAALERGRSSKH